jgi:hypothetical protein
MTRGWKEFKNVFFPSLSHLLLLLLHAHRMNNLSRQLSSNRKAAVFDIAILSNSNSLIRYFQPEDGVLEMNGVGCVGIVVSDEIYERFCKQDPKKVSECRRQNNRFFLISFFFCL